MQHSIININIRYLDCYTRHTNIVLYWTMNAGKDYLSFSAAEEVEWNSIDEL